MERIVVGVDESSSAAAAVRWAVRERDLRGGTLTAVLAWTYLGQHHDDGDDAFQPDYSERDAVAVLDRILHEAAPGAVDSIEQEVVCDLPARALLDASANAGLLVVGARGLGGFRGVLLGSVSQQCAHHTTVPIAIVRTAPAATRTGAERIVVGVDGSATSQHALAWAHEEARLRKASLVVVHAWQPAIVPVVAPVIPFYDSPTIDEHARHLVATQLHRLEADDLPTSPEVLVVDDSPARAMLDAAATASLVVVGSRGRGGFAGLLLGSVSQHVVHHADCPVVVIPHALAGAHGR